MEKKRVVLKEGLMREENGLCELLAVRCGRCGRIHFPRRALCPDCLGREMETVGLSGGATLSTYTIVNMPSEHFSPPYAIGWVEFPEGVKAFGQIRGHGGSGNAELRIGMAMRLVSDILWEEEDREVVGYVFTPAEGPAGWDA